MLEPKLTRSQSDKMLAGVCGGLAAYLGIDSTIVRLAFLLLIPASGLGLLVYLILAAIMPADASAEGEENRIKIHVQETTGGETATRPRRAHPQGPTIAGILLVLVGLYLLLDIPVVVFWSLLLVGLGALLVLRRR
jgi:phage shock protein C